MSWFGIESVMRVRARGAMKLQVTPYFPISRATLIVSAAIAAFAIA
jgi:hypothetical protein